MKHTAARLIAAVRALGGAAMGAASRGKRRRRQGQTGATGRLASAGGMNPSSGMGIIEMIVGLALMTIAILGLSGLAVSAVRGNVSARAVDQATRLAQQKLEQVKANGYPAAAIGTTVESDLNAAGTVGGGFTRTTVIAPGPLSTTKTVGVTLAWSDFAAARSTTFVTEILE